MRIRIRIRIRNPARVCLKLRLLMPRWGLSGNVLILSFSTSPSWQVDLFFSTSWGTSQFGFEFLCNWNFSPSLTFFTALVIWFQLSKRHFANIFLLPASLTSFWRKFRGPFAFFASAACSFILIIFLHWIRIFTNLLSVIRIRMDPHHFKKLDPDSHGPASF